MERLLTAHTTNLKRTVEALKTAVENWDPEINAGLDQIIPFLQDPPKFTTRERVQNEGVSDSVELEGTWDCTLSGFGGQALSRDMV